METMMMDHRMKRPVYRCYVTNAYILITQYNAMMITLFVAILIIHSLYFHAVQELTQIEKTFISSVLPIMGMI